MSLLNLTHLVFVISAFASFAVGILIGSLFLIQEYHLKRHRPVSPKFHLPSLESTDSLHYKILTIGFLLLSCGMITGALLSKRISGSFFTADPRQVLAVITWGIYAVFLNVRIRSGWRGKRGILLALLGFATVALTFFAVHHRGLG